MSAPGSQGSTWSLLDRTMPEDPGAPERRLAQVEEQKREAKRLRKAVRPKDHRDEGGQG